MAKFKVQWKFSSYGIIWYLSFNHKLLNNLPIPFSKTHLQYHPYVVIYIYSYQITLPFLVIISLRQANTIQIINDVYNRCAIILLISVFFISEKPNLTNEKKCSSTFRALCWGRGRTNWILPLLRLTDEFHLLNMMLSEHQQL